MLTIVLKYIEEKHYCPHCSGDLKLCHAPPVHVGDGLGWGSEFLFVCLNDECPLFIKGWEYIENQYGHVGSYRYMEIPDSKESYNMMVVGKDAFTGSVVDIEAFKRQSERYKLQQDAIAALENCVALQQLEPVLTLLLDDSVSSQTKKRAVEMLVPLNDVACVEPLRNCTFKDPHLEHEVKLALAKILANHFLKECPHCAELIKARALVCKHCQRELAS